MGLRERLNELVQQSQLSTKETQRKQRQEILAGEQAKKAIIESLDPILTDRLRVLEGLCAVGKAARRILGNPPQIYHYCYDDYGENRRFKPVEIGKYWPYEHTFTAATHAGTNERFTTNGIAWSPSWSLYVFVYGNDRMNILNIGGIQKFDDGIDGNWDRIDGGISKNLDEWTKKDVEDTFLCYFPR